MGGIERRRDVAGGGADQVGAIAQLEVARERAVALVLPQPAEDDVQATTRNAASARRAAATLVAFESLTQRTPRTTATSSIRCGTPSSDLSPTPIASSSMPAARAASRCRGVLAVVAPGDRRLGGERVARVELEPPRRARNVTEAARHHRRLIRALVAEDAKLGVGVRLVRPVVVDVVGLEVEQDGDGGASVCVSSSCCDESSQTIQASSRSWPTSAVSGGRCSRRPPPACPPLRKSSPSKAVVVVFPFVPVTPMSGLRSRRAPTSISLQSARPRSRAAVGRAPSPGFRGS